MDDYIRRQAAHRLIDNREYDLSNPIQKDLFHNAVNNLPSAEVPHWIPCRERLPEVEPWKSVEVLTSTGNTVKIMTYGYQRKKGPYWMQNLLGFTPLVEGDPEAWMPLPRPFNPIKRKRKGADHDGTGQPGQ